jgi:predicted anti-sigma-YlaC factor YlaD
MVTCQQATELATDYLEGHLPWGQRLSFLLHLSLCPRCRLYLRQLRTTIRTLRGLTAEANVRPEVEAELLARFRQARHARGAAAHGGTSSWLRALAGFDALLGGWRGVTFVASLVVGLSALHALTGDAGGVRPDLHCVVSQLAACLGLSMAAALVLRGTAALQALRLSASSYASLAVVTALPWHFVMTQRCPLAGVARHAIVIHLGSLLLGALLAVAIGRAPHRLP